MIRYWFASLLSVIVSALNLVTIPVCGLRDWITRKRDRLIISQVKKNREYCIQKLERQINGHDLNN